LPAVVTQLRHHLAACAVERVKSLAHQGKGAAGMYGFPALSQAFAELETACPAGQASAQLSGRVEQIAAAVESIQRGVE
jgi:HPt (histidine-containing phosphotransfer) domain-containing protein